jgi:hypothetical protein
VARRLGDGRGPRGAGGGPGLTTLLLSPADCRGRRASILLREEADFPLAVDLRAGRAALGDVFAFVSGLYFRGKLAYARRFGTFVRVIVPGRGLLPPDIRVATAHIEAFAQVPVDLAEPAYLRPLARDLRLLADEVAGPVVLLGSVATRKYLAPLAEALRDRLAFPTPVARNGDISPGPQILDAVKAGIELDYGPVPSTTRRQRQSGP